jgi:hypothetical protein
MVEANIAFEPQLLRPIVELRNGNAVTERVVQPAKIDRFRRDRERRFEKLLVIAVARPEHHAVRAERHRPVVSIERNVADGEDSHRQIEFGLRAHLT